LSIWAPICDVSDNGTLFLYEARYRVASKQHKGENEMSKHDKEQKETFVPVIEDDVPIPPICYGPRGNADKYKLKQLKPGQSIVFPMRIGVRALGRAASIRKEMGWKFSSRTSFVDGKKIMRIWRTK